MNNENNFINIHHYRILSEYQQIPKINKTKKIHIYVNLV